MKYVLSALVMAFSFSAFAGVTIGQTDDCSKGTAFQKQQCRIKRDKDTTSTYKHPFKNPAAVLVGGDDCSKGTAYQQQMCRIKRDKNTTSTYKHPFQKPAPVLVPGPNCKLGNAYQQQMCRIARDKNN